MDEHDLTDHHGEAEALRRENARMRAELASGSFYKEADIDALMARAEAAEAALAAAPVAEAQPVAWGQTGVRDRHGRMICVGDRIRIDLTSPATKREYWQPEYIVEWKPPAFKLRHVGGDKDSDTARWKFSTVQPSSTAALEIISQHPSVQPNWQAMAERLGEIAKVLIDWLDYDFSRGISDEEFEARQSLRTALADLAKMKGE